MTLTVVPVLSTVNAVSILSRLPDYHRVQTDASESDCSLEDDHDLLPSEWRELCQLEETSHSPDYMTSKRVDSGHFAGVVNGIACYL